MPCVGNNSPKASDEVSDGEEYFDPNDAVEVIEIDDNTDMDQVADHLMDVLGDADGNEEEDEMVEEQEEIEEEGDVISPSYSFNKHTKPAYSCSLNSSGTLAASGDEDDCAYMWNTSSGDVLLTCSGHKDTVEQCQFSEDDKYLATADMSGIVQVWKVQSGEKVFSFETTPDDITVLTWFKHVLMCGTKEGHLWVWLIPSGLSKFLSGHGAQVTAASFTKDGQGVLVGYSDGIVRAFDIKSEAKIDVEKHPSHAEDILCIDTHQDGRLAITGGADGTAKLVIITNIRDDTNRHAKVVCTWSSTNEGEEETDVVQPSNSVESVKFSSTPTNLAAVGRLSGLVSIYDITNQSLRYNVVLLGGVSRMIASPSSPSLYCACLDGVIRILDFQTGKQTARLKGHTKAVMDICSNRSGSKILTASEDGTASVFSITQ